MDITLDIPAKETIHFDEVDHILMVCSHERSGTHFLMNSLGSCTKYTSNPWLNYDLMPYGGTLNFYSSSSVMNFFSEISRLDAGNSNILGLASIVKSHFPVSLVQCALGTGLKIAYIYRNPVDTLISFWKLLHGFNWFEGPKLDSPLQLAQHIPCGQSQRYQMQNCGSYFDRWAMHVTDAVQVACHSSDIILVSYESLVRNHAATTKNLVDNLGLELTKEPIYPSRDKNVIFGAQMEVSDEDMQELREYCADRARLYPDLPMNILDGL